MITTAKVSVIMATFNCEDTIISCIDSIINQTFDDWEFVICDDCSTDRTFELLSLYQKDYPERIKLLKNQQNCKLAYSLNRCLEHSKGEYIARMDGDDESYPERLEKQVAFLDAHTDVSVVGTGMIPFDERGDRPVMVAKQEPNGADLLSGPCFFHATIMMRKTAYDLVNGYHISKRTQRAQDYDMWFRFFANGLKGINLQEGLYHVREDKNAMKRRTFISRCYEVQTRLIGYRLLKYPWYKYIYAFKPLLVTLVPNQLMMYYHSQDKKRNDGE